MTYMIITVDDDAEHVHPAIYLTHDAALKDLKEKIGKMVGKEGEDNSGVSEFYEHLETATTFDAVYHLVDGAHWGENNIKVLHVIDLAKAVAVF